MQRSSIGDNWRVAFKVCNPDGLELLDEHGFEDGHWHLVQSRQKLVLLRLVGLCDEDRIVQEVADRWGNDVERREIFGVRRLEVHQHNDVDESHVDLALQHRVEALEVRARRTHKTRASDVAVATPAAGVESAFPGHVPLLGKRHESTGAARRTIVDGDVLELLLDDILQARHTGGSFERDEEGEGARRRESGVGGDDVTIRERREVKHRRCEHEAELSHLVHKRSAARNERRVRVCKPVRPALRLLLTNGLHRACFERLCHFLDVGRRP